MISYHAESSLSPEFVRPIVHGEDVPTPGDAAGLQLDDEAAQMIGMLAALGQHTRFRLVTELLASDSGRMSVNSLADTVGILQNSASAHLAILARVGIIRATRQGKQRLYHVNEERLHWLVGGLSRAFSAQEG